MYTNKYFVRVIILTLLSGEFHDWWDNVTEASFLEKAHCFEASYDGFPIPGTNLTGSGDLVLGEVIADNGGVAESYRAYSE